MKKFMSFFEEIVSSWWGAVAFYTIIPLPSSWSLQLERVARFAPLIGVLLGSLLAIADWGFSVCGVPILTRSALIIASGLALTGGLHLDGVIDSADGLAVLDPQRRLTVMKDSATGAFGVIAAVVVLLLKVAAFSEIEEIDRGWVLILTLGWGRWGQVCAIALYPYLRSEGKGSFHKESLRFTEDVGGGWIALGLISIWGAILLNLGGYSVLPLLFGTVIPLLVGWWFNRQLGGHTGDTYGAVVEWSEALYLCLLTTL
jgi:adenosylcobinamide-GDP ribazoletransferase